jgi:hypothetical protein
MSLNNMNISYINYIIKYTKCYGNTQGTTFYTQQRLHLEFYKQTVDTEIPNCYCCTVPVYMKVYKYFWEFCLKASSLVMWLAERPWPRFDSLQEHYTSPDRLWIPISLGNHLHECWTNEGRMCPLIYMKFEQENQLGLTSASLMRLYVMTLRISVHFDCMVCFKSVLNASKNIFY